MRTPPAPASSFFPGTSTSTRMQLPHNCLPFFSDFLFQSSNQVLNTSPPHILYSFSRESEHVRCDIDLTCRDRPSRRVDVHNDVLHLGKKHRHQQMAPKSSPTVLLPMSRGKNGFQRRGSGSTLSLHPLQICQKRFNNPGELHGTS